MADLHLNTKEIVRTVADLPCPPGLPLLGNLFQKGPKVAVGEWSR